MLTRQSWIYGVRWRQDTVLLKIEDGQLRLARIVSPEVVYDDDAKLWWRDSTKAQRASQNLSDNTTRLSA
jgi:hypothetical protein